MVALGSKLAFAYRPEFQSRWCVIRNTGIQSIAFNSSTMAPFSGFTPLLLVCALAVATANQLNEGQCGNVDSDGHFNVPEGTTVIGLARTASHGAAPEEARGPGSRPASSVACGAPARLPHPQVRARSAAAHR